MGSRSISGAKIFFIDSSYYRDPEFYVTTSYVTKNELNFIIVDSNEVYGAKIENTTPVYMDTILHNSRVHKMHNSYKQNLYKLPNQLLKFSSIDSKSFGLIEIDGSSIKVPCALIVK